MSPPRSSPKSKLTIRDFANLANTSTATVSRAFSNKPGVSQAKRKQILELAERVGFQPNAIARNLALRKSHLIGIVVADLLNTMYVHFLRHVQQHVAEIGYQVLIADSNQTVEKEIHNIKMMQRQQVEGLIIFPVHDWHEDSGVNHLLELKLASFPFVLVGKIDGYGFDYVTSEERKTACRLASHLIELGHRDIGFVGCEETNRCICERLAGVQDALKAHGLDLNPEYCIEHRPGWPDEMIRMLKRPNRPSGVVIINDVCSLHAYKPLQQAGIRIPQDLSIVTFGDQIWARHMNPPLTTTEEDISEVARRAMDALIKRIEDPERSSMQLEVPQKVILRDSVGRFEEA